MQSQIYQRNFQLSLKKQVDGFLKDLTENQYNSIEEYMKNGYETGFLGTMYDLHGQGIPIITPIDQKQVVKAMQLDPKISKNLYTKLGEDVTLLKKRIANNVSRGIATSDSYANIARNVASTSNVGFNRAMRIARTEGHRVQVEAASDAQYAAKEAGADVVKQWDAALDGRTRESHARVDGEIRELDEKFSNGLKYPGDSAGGAAEVVNCRCALLQRARWALDDDELETLKERAKYYGLDKTKNFDDFKAKYLKAAEAEVKQAGEVTTIEELQKYAASKMDKWGVSVDVSGTGKYLEEVKENIDLIDGLMAEYNSTMVDLQFKGGFDRKSGGTYMLNGKSSMFVRLQGSSSMADTLKVGKNKKFKTATHEFAHTLSQSDEKIDAEFWKEIKSVKNKYNRALTKIDKSELVEHTMTASEAAAAKSKIFISDYGNTTVDEFLAEAFAQARLAESPSPFSVEVLNIVDKYFKKSAAKKAQKVVEKVKKPAKTVKEAEEYAKQFVKEKTWSGNGNVSYKGLSLESANKFNETLLNLYEQNDIHLLNNIQPMNFRQTIWKGSETTPMAYRSAGDGDLFFNPKIMKNAKSLDAYMEEGRKAFKTCAENIDKFKGTDRELIETYLKAGSSLVAETTDDAMKTIIEHEMGHHIQHSIIYNSEEMAKIVADGFEEYGVKISGYATKTKGEYIAESYAAFCNGKAELIDPKLKDIFENIRKTGRN